MKTIKNIISSNISASLSPTPFINFQIRSNLKYPLEDTINSNFGINFITNLKYHNSGDQL